MARGRLISRSLGSSRKFREVLRIGGKLGEFCQVLFPLIVVNADDFGRLVGDSFTVKNVVFPTSPRPERDFERALHVLTEAKLITRYQVDDRIVIQINQFDAHQPNLHKRSKSHLPDNPGISGNLPENSGKNTEHGTQNSELRTQNPEPRDERESSDVLFERFWAAYPKKKSKDDARRAWDKRRPNRDLCEQMLAAIERQRRSADWLKDGGQYIPYPATWLNKGRWLDEPDDPVVTAISDQTRQNMAAIDAWVGDQP